MAPSPPNAPLGIYIHIPFCSHICPYCDFNTYAGQEELIPRYVAAVERELTGRAATVTGRPVETIYFGGGTPSLLPAADIGRLIRACRTSFAVTADAEISLEANPNSVDAAYFAGLREAGVNRLSIGVQSLQRRGLRVLGRQHEAADAAAAIRAARTAGFTNINLDLIFGWPGQTLTAWNADLSTILDWGDARPEHLSLYSLIVEPGTPMAEAVARGILSPLDDDAAADLYERAISRLAEAGFRHYEVANWAATAGLESRHNRIYWRNGDYLGIGAGAHGHLAGIRTMNHLLPATYIDAIAAGRSPVSNREIIAPRTAIGETMMLGLRLLDEGVGDRAFATRHGVSLIETFAAEIDDLVKLGLLDRLPDRVRLTQRGLMVANDVCARFLA